MRALLPIALTALLAVVPTAAASTLESFGQAGSLPLEWNGTSGDDALTVTAADAGALTFTASDAITVDPALAGTCSSSAAQVVTCTIGDSKAAVFANGANGRDTIRMEAPSALVADGGTGDDALVGGPEADSLIGSAGTDTFSGGAGNDSLHAGDGTAEQLDCGDGTDVQFSDAFDTRIACERDGATEGGIDWAAVNQAKRENMGLDEEEAPRREAPGILVHRFAVRRGGTVVRKLRLGGLARRSTVTFRCRGESCPFARKTLRPKTRKAALEGFLGGRLLKRGTTLTIEIDARGRDTKLFGYTVRSGRQPIRFA